MGRNMKLGCCFIAVTFMILAAGCGGSSSDTSGSGGITITSTVSMPTGTASISARPGKTVTEAPSEGVEVRLEDLSGNLLGTCTTAADGICAITVNTNVNSVVISTPYLDAIHVIETAESDAGAVSIPVNTETALAYALAVHHSVGDLVTWSETVDVNNYVEGIAAAVGDESAEAGTNGGDTETSGMAMAGVIMGGHDGAELFISAYNGDPAPLLTALGAETIANSTVPVSEALAGSAIFSGKILEAYYTRDPVTLLSPFEATEAVVREAGLSFDSAAMTVAAIAPFEHLTTAELISIVNAEGLRGYMQNLPYVPTITEFANDIFQQAISQAVRAGAFADATMGGPVVAALWATIPPDGTITESNYSWMTAGFAAANAAFYYAANGDMNASPAMIAINLVPALSNADGRASFAYGGSAACATYMDPMISTMRDPSVTFSGANYVSFIPSPPGGDCTTDANCTGGSLCVSGVCSQLSTLTGTACTNTCDNTTVCYGGWCMNAASVATAAQDFVTTASGTQYTPSAAGTMGSPCSTAADCPGLTCSAHVCINQAEMTNIGNGGPCSAPAQCASLTCTSMVCVGNGTSYGTGTLGSACSTNSYCATGICTNWMCAAAGSGSGAGADGATCTPTSSTNPASSGCQSGICCTGGAMVCGSGCSAGSICNASMQCGSTYCDFMTHMCSPMP